MKLKFSWKHGGGEGEHKPIGFCDTCGEEIYDGELYGQRDGQVMCLECANNKWYGLSAAEKFEFLGYDVGGLGRSGLYTT